MTDEADTSELKKAIESMHGGTATFVQDVPVKEMFDDATVWEGVVSVFELADNPQATRAYAWSYELPDGKRRFFSVLHTNKINSPVAAVRAAIVAEFRDRKGN